MRLPSSLRPGVQHRHNTSVKHPVLCVLLHLAFAASLPAASSVTSLGDTYLDRYFRTYPTRATMAGRHDLDRQLEYLDEAERASWLVFNRTMRASVAALRPATHDEAIDRTLLRRAIQPAIYQIATPRIPAPEPLPLILGIRNSLSILILL